MRDFLDAILMFIGSESLTDEEFDGIDATDEEYTQETFDLLKAVLESRDSVSTQLDKLAYYFLAKGVAVTGSEPTAKSHIFVGASIQCP